MKDELEDTKKRTGFLSNHSLCSVSNYSKHTHSPQTRPAADPTLTFPLFSPLLSPSSFLPFYSPPSMATPSAAAALLAAALPKPSGSTSNHPQPSGSGRGGVGARGSTRGSRQARGQRGARVDEDIGMSDASEGTVNRRRGRQARSGPMGERPSRGRNVPGTLSDRMGGGGGSRASSLPSNSTGKAKASDPPSSSTIDTLRLFLLNRYSQPDRMLNMENMAEDPVLKEHKLIAPGQPGAPSNMAGAIWKLAKEMFPDVRSKALISHTFTELVPPRTYRSSPSH